MNDIDFKDEARKLAKECGSIEVANLEKAMRHGAVLIAIKTTEKVKATNDELQRRYKANLGDVALVNPQKKAAE